MSNSTDKLDVEIIPTKYGKRWVSVTLKNGSKSFLVSFEDLYRMIEKIVACETEKYPEASGGGKNLIARFLCTCVFHPEYGWEEIARMYKLPIRNGETVVDANGAKYNPETFIK